MELVLTEACISVYYFLSPGDKLTPKWQAHFVRSKLHGNGFRIKNKRMGGSRRSLYNFSIYYLLLEKIASSV